jgi:hypothetical protein
MALCSLNNNGKNKEVQVHMLMLFDPRTRVWKMELAPEEVSHSLSFPAASLGLPQIDYITTLLVQNTNKKQKTISSANSNPRV